MPPARASLEGPFARSVREALESVASPELVERVIAMSLVAARRATIPEDAAPFSAYVEGPLRGIVMQLLGYAEYEVVAERLAHVLQMATSQISSRRTTSRTPEKGPDDEYWEEDSQVRLTGAPGSLERPALELDLDDPAFHLPAPTAHDRLPVPTRTSSAPRVTAAGRAIARITTPPRPMPAAAASKRPTPVTLRPPSAAPEHVIVLTLDPLLVAETESRLRGSRILCVDTTGALLTTLASARGRVAIVVDSALPSIDVPTVAALADAFPAGTVVVLWGMSERQKDRLAAMFPVARGWIAGGVAASPADVLAQAK